MAIYADFILASNNIMTRESAARKRKTALTYLECYQTVKLGELT